MAKDGFVRDNLIDMRDHLKAAREAILAGTDPHEAARKAEAASKNETRNTSINSTQAAVNTDAADQRALREFYGRVIHDKSAAEAALRQLEARSGNISKFHNVLADLESQLSASESISSRKLEQMQFTYYMAAGEYKGASGYQDAPAAAGGQAETETKSAGRIFAESLPIVIAVIASSILVATTLILIFA